MASVGKLKEPLLGVSALLLLPLGHVSLDVVPTTTDEQNQDLTPETQQKMLKISQKGFVQYPAADLLSRAQ